MGAAHRRAPTLPPGPRRLWPDHVRRLRSRISPDRQMDAGIHRGGIRQGRGEEDVHPRPRCPVGRAGSNREATRRIRARRRTPTNRRSRNDCAVRVPGRGRLPSSRHGFSDCVRVSAPGIQFGFWISGHRTLVPPRPRLALAGPVSGQSARGDSTRVPLSTRGASGCPICRVEADHAGLRATNYIRWRRFRREGRRHMPSPRKTRSLTVAHGEIDASDKTTSLLLPNRDHGPWLPFERFAETMTTSRTKLGRHSHQAEEVVIYLVEGEVDHMDGSGRREGLTPGSVAVLTAHEEISHDLEMLKGKRARWLSVVVRLPWHTEAPPTTIQIKTAGDATEESDGTVQKPVVGPLARADGSSGLEFTDIEFARQATAFFRSGRDRRAVAYVLDGSGMIDDVPLKSGSGALLENMSAVAIGGAPGYRIVLAAVPIPAQHEDPPDAAPRRVK